MSHKSRTPSEHSAKANSMLERNGYAKGGAIKGPKNINIIIKTGGDKPMPMPVPVPGPGAQGGLPPAGQPPMMRPGIMGAPPSAPQMPTRPPGFKAGGAVKKKSEGGPVNGGAPRPTQRPRIPEDDWEDFSTRVNGRLQTGKANYKTGETLMDAKPADWYTKDPWHGSKTSGLAKTSQDHGRAGGGTVKVKAHVRRKSGGPVK